MTITEDYRVVQPAIDTRTSAVPALVRPVLVARNGEQVPVRPVAPVSPFTRIFGQVDSRDEYEARQPAQDEATSDVLAGALVIEHNNVAAPAASSQFLAQYIAQQEQGESRTSKVDDEASVAAYRAAAERGTVFFGLEYPIDLSV